MAHVLMFLALFIISLSFKYQRCLYGVTKQHVFGWIKAQIPWDEGTIPHPWLKSLMIVGVSKGFSIAYYWNLLELKWQRG